MRKYHPSDDISLIEKAYEVAGSAHANQMRKSGEPYIVHPLYVAIILADLEMDKETIDRINSSSYSKMYTGLNGDSEYIMVLKADNGFGSRIFTAEYMNLNVSLQFTAHLNENDLS